ncbi:MAG: TRAP transporter small permease [Bacillaceae bacterium]|nr:TRAP transporter small permease [Bacillaceae bacterium]
MERTKRIVEALEDWISGLLIAGGLGLIFLGVIMRYVFNSPLGWIEEISGYIIVWGILIGTVVALRDNRHIRVDILYQFIPDTAKKWVDVFSNVVGLIFSLFLLIYGIKGIFLDEFSVYKMNLVSIGEGITLWKIYMVMPIVGALLSARFIIRIVRLLKGLPETDQKDEGGELMS